MCTGITMNQCGFSLCLILLLLVSFLSGTVSAQELKPKAKPDAALIGTLKRLHNYGCDCKLQSVKAARRNLGRNYLLQSDLGATLAWMNIDGKDIRLKLVYASSATNGVLLGSRSYKKFSSRGISVLIRYVVNAVCAEENPDCDEVGHIATISVNKNGRRQTIKAIGMCGWC
jgi:hypothetical protein